MTVKRTEANTKFFQQRMPADLAVAAERAAAELGVSRNEFINRATSEAVLRGAKPTPVGSGGLVQFELSVEFRLAGDDADSRAYRLLDQIQGLTELAGAADATPRLVRLATMQPRTNL